MSKAALARFEAETAARKEAEAQAQIEKLARQEAWRKKQEVDAVIGAVAEKVKAALPKRFKGTGLRRRESQVMKDRAHEWLDGVPGFEKMQRFVHETALEMLQIDAKYGTEPWRAKGNHGPALSANSRVRFTDNAIRIIEDMRKALNVGGNQKLLKDVFDAEIVDRPETDGEAS